MGLFDATYPKMRDLKWKKTHHQIMAYNVHLFNEIRLHNWQSKPIVRMNKLAGHSNEKQPL